MSEVCLDRALSFAARNGMSERTDLADLEGSYWDRAKDFLYNKAMQNANP